MADRNWKEKVLDNGDVWNKEDPLEGELIKVESDVGPKKSMMYTLKTDDDVIKVWGSTVLDDKLLGVPIGTYIKLEYDGLKPGKSGNSYHSFRVFINESDEMPEDFLDK